MLRMADATGMKKIRLHLPEVSLRLRAGSWQVPGGCVQVVGRRRRIIGRIFALA